MAFEMAYDLKIDVGKEVVFVLSDDWHRKVRIIVTEKDEQGDKVNFQGNSYGSSYPGIKAAKKDESPVKVKGQFQRSGNKWTGTLESFK